jgi:N-acetylneuraminic acid mutarotase
VEYDPSANLWTVKANYPGTGKENTAGFAIGNKGYVGTGYTGSTTVKDFFEYDPALNIWAIKDSFPGPTRSGAAGWSIGSKGYIGLGNNTNSTANFKDVYEYDPSANSWTQKADFTLPYVIAPCTYSGVSSGYVLCGYYYQYTKITHNPLNMLYKYDQATDTWELSGTFCGLPRGYAAGFSISNDIYIGCGLH